MIPAGTVTTSTVAAILAVEITWDRWKLKKKLRVLEIFVGSYEISLTCYLSLTQFAQTPENTKGCGYHFIAPHRPKFSVKDIDHWTISQPFETQVHS